MKYESYNPAEIEPEMLKFWEEHKIVEKLRERNKNGEKFYFLKGPPYTSGRIHLGHAWNMALKDMVLRYKRMKGFKVWDRMGYDMHGLPTEQKVMKKFELKNKEDIEKFGIKKFTEECGKFCVEMMGYMNTDFKRIGATLDFTDPYQPITQSFMESEWWLIKTAYEKGRLYQGLRTMHWDAATQTSVAKHELDYKSVTDTSIFVKFQLVEKPNTYFIIWTTTPWTIPLNLAVMVNPELDYVDVDADGETWIVAKSLVESVMKKAEIDQHKILREFKGEEMEGWTYHHPLNLKQYLPDDLQQNPKLYAVLLSKEYVDDSAGTGLVHCAPGCGPEDYEVGHKNGIPPFNCVNEGGFFENFGSLTGLKAKTDDKKFITEIEKSSALIAKQPYTHDYPYGERSKEPVIFRTTKQWFFRVEDLREKMLAANEEIMWNPVTAKNAYRSWLEHLRDNSITKQRYWGTAVPIWTCKETDEHIVVGSVKELEKLSGQKVASMHIPDIDKIQIQKDGKIFKRMPDVLDVWIDAGTVSWNCLRYPEIKEDFEEMFPADFILEGKDQIRGWFNLLMIASMLAFEKPSFKNVVMHGFINDNSGVKMSKSLGNIIAPFELISKHGADTLRLYTCQTSAGADLNFSWDEAANKSRGISILWNVHKLFINLCNEQGIKPFALDETKMREAMGAEEKYIVSKLHSTIKRVTELMEAYHLDEIIAPLEELFLEISRTYIQMVRDKSTLGSQREKEVVAYTLATTILETLKMCQLVIPFVCEAMYQNFKEEYWFKEESISHFGWPKYSQELIDKEIESQMELAGQVITSGAHAREKAKLGLRWPIKELVIVSTNSNVERTVNDLKEIMKGQLNTKEVRVVHKMEGLKVTVKPNPGTIGKAFGKLAPTIMKHLSAHEKEVATALDSGRYTFAIESQEIEITKEMLHVSREAPVGYTMAEFKQGIVYVNTERTVALESEGYAREVSRQVQQQRKDASLERIDQITLSIDTSNEMKEMLSSHLEDMKDKVGAVTLEFGIGSEGMEESEFKVKGHEFKIWFKKI